MLVLQRSFFRILSICCKVITGSRYLFSTLISCSFDEFLTYRFQLSSAQVSRHPPMEWLFPLRANNGLGSIMILTVPSHATLRMVTSLMVRAEYRALKMVLGAEIRAKFAVKVWNIVDVMYTQQNLNLTSTVNWNGRSSPFKIREASVLWSIRLHTM